LGRFKGGIKNAGKFDLYSITKDLPEKIETLQARSADWRQQYS